MSLKRCVSFSEVDPMGVLWHGRYASYFEQASESLGRLCNMTYKDFKREGLQLPIVQFHVDFFASAVLAEEVTIKGRLIWDEGARLNTEYEIIKENGTLAASGYTVQVFITTNGEHLIVSPPLLQRCRENWVKGDFY